MQADDEGPIETATESLGPPADRIRELAEHLGAAVCELDADGRMLYVNPRMEALTGYTTKQLVTMTPSDLVHPDDLEALVAHRRAALRSDAPEILSFRAVHRDGTIRWLEATTAGYDAAGGNRRVATLLRNVTGQLARKAALEKRLQLETLLADLSRRFLLTDALEIDAAICDGLAELAKVGEAERAFLLCLPQNERETSSFFEWHDETLENREEVPTVRASDHYPNFARAMMNGEVMRVPVVRDLPDDFAEEREALLAAGVRSYLLLPSTAGTRVVGVLGLHCVEKEHDWTEAELDMLRLMTDLLAGAVRQKRYETALAESEERFRALTDNARDPICEISPSGEILYVSPAYAELLGMTQADLLGRDAYGHIHADDRGAIRDGIDDVLAGDDRGVVVYRTRHRDGHWIYIEASARSFASAGGEARLVAVLRDVTERERNRIVLDRQFETEKRVAALSRFFLEVEPASIGRAIQQKLATVAEIAESDYSFMYTIDPSGKSQHRLYQHWSPGTDPQRTVVPGTRLRESAWRIPEMLEQGAVIVPSLDALPPESIAERAHMESRGVKSFLGIPLVYDRRMIGFMGFETIVAERSWSRETTTLLRLAAEIFVSALRREQADLELERSRNQLVQSQKMEAVGTLAGGIAHDFNNHLAVMLGNARFVLGEIGEDPEVREALVDLQRSAEHCAQLTRSLLAFSRRSPAHVDAILVREIMKTVAELVRPLLPSSIHLEVQSDEPEDSVRADSAQLRQVLVNLLVNARDAMPSGGRLTLGSGRREITSVEASQLGLPKREAPAGLEAESASGEEGLSSYVEISIRDTGGGMAPEIQERIFEPFFTTKPLGQGTGLGLATAYGIVQQSGGVITVESERGVGSLFRVLLPCCEPAPDEDEARSRVDTLPGSETVLLVEDEPAVRRLVARILRGAGYEVIEAADGIEGLEMAERHREHVQLVITDMVMPRMGGAELAAKLQTTRPDLRVLLLSGHAEPLEGDRWNEVHSARFLQKPFGENALLSEVRLLLESA